jgi:Leucine-rich repeat (LRR) protein
MFKCGFRDFICRFFYYFACLNHSRNFILKIMKISYIPFIFMSVVPVMPSCGPDQTPSSDIPQTTEPASVAEMPAEPSRDKALLDRLSLYRAKRYESLSDAIASSDTVYKLVLHGKKLGKIPPEIARLKYLNTLDLAFNDLTEVPPYIQDMEYLQGLYLNGNMITGIPSFVYDYRHLSRWDISENQLTSVSPEIQNLTQLVVLNLRENKLTEFPAEIYNLRQLKSFHLDHNQLSAIPEGITALSNLTNLRLEYNQLTDFPDELGYMVQLKELWLQGNPIPMKRISYLRAKLPTTRVRF